MNVFVAGASGAIGRPLVRKLRAQGHEVAGMTRREEIAEELRRDGAAPVVLDVFDADGVMAAVKEFAPEVLVHQLTSLPDTLDFRDKSAYDATNRVRTEGTSNLVAASRAAGVKKIVAQSICFVYTPEGERVKKEGDPVWIDAPEPFGGAIRGALELEEQVLGIEEIEGIVLRYGFFYGPGTFYAPDGSQAREVRRRRLPIVGDGGGVFSFIHVDDAADATVGAVERGKQGTYHVVDDEPAPMREWLPVYAEELGAKKPMRVPKLVARLAAGQLAASMATELRGASNGKAKRELAWEPRHKSWREGFKAELAGAA